MPRVKRGTSHVKKRKKVLKRAKGFKWGRKKKVKLAKTAITKAGAKSYIGRKQKKRNQRRLWQVRLNAAVRKYDLNYNQFIDLLKKNKIELDRKILSDIAQKNPEIFEQIIKSLKK